MRVSMVRLQGKRGVIARQRFIAPKQVVQAGSAIGVGVGIIRLECDRAIEIRQRLLKPTKLSQRVAAVVDRFGEVSIELDGPIEYSERLVEALQLGQRQPEIAEGIDDVGPDLGDFAEVRGRLLKPAHVQQHHAHVVSRDVVLRVQRQRHGVTRDRFLAPHQRLKAQGFAHQGLGPARMDSVGLLEPRKRLGMKLQLDQQRPAFVHRIEMTRVERKRVIIGQQRFLESLLLALEIADPDPDAGAIRFELERDFIALQGFRKPALARQIASEAGKKFGIALIDMDRAHHEIDREVDPVGLRVELTCEIERAGVLWLQRQRPLYPLFGDREQSRLKMPQTGIIQRCDGVLRLIDLAAGTGLFALHNLVQVRRCWPRYLR